MLLSRYILIFEILENRDSLNKWWVNIMSHKKAQESKILSEEKQKEKNNQYREYLIMGVGLLGVIIFFLLIMGGVNAKTQTYTYPQTPFVACIIPIIGVISGFMLLYPVIKNVVYKRRIE
jgi:uncharacterized integral membrane protein